MALETPSWLNLDFVEGILRRSQGDNSIQVIDIYSKPATAKGDNYASDMFRALVEFSRNQGDKKINEKKSIIIKVSPTIVGIRKTMIEQSKIFHTEISMMTDTLERMNELLGNGTRLNARVLHVQTENPTLLVIEDLAPLGFRMADRQAGLDLAHCLLAIRGLAKFHASSIAVCEKDPAKKKEYKKGLFWSCGNYETNDIAEFFVLGTKSLATEVETWPELGKRYADKIRAIAPQIYEKGKEIAQPRENDLNVINHGDSWVNNMLFKYNDEGKPSEHIFVDFQMCIYTSPGVDLNYFLSTSPAEEVFDHARDVLLKEYLHTLSSTMKQLRCKTPIPSMEDLKRCLRERAFYGMLASFTVLPLVLLDKSEAKDIEELLQPDGSYSNPGYKGKIYRRVMTKRIPLYEEMGLFDL